MDTMETTEKEPFFTIPVAIFLAGVMISFAVIYSAGRNATQPANVGDSLGGRVVPAAVDNIKPVTSDDHIRGNPNAPIKIVEFSDIECPFCKRFHSTMKQVLEEYPDEVAWVYRHFPLDQIHPNARSAAEASECIAVLGGNDKFWAYLDTLFERTFSLNRSGLASAAEQVGVNRSAFETCLSSGKHANDVENDYQDGVSSGAQGTPYSVVVTKDDQKLVISGAQPFSAVKQILDAVLK